MKRLRYPFLILLAAICAFGLFLLYSALTWYNPPQQLLISESKIPDTISCDSNLSIVSWNIGYAGLGNDMDFFYDGGNKVRTTAARTAQNIDSISHFLKQISAKTFILIQEVDVSSKRSYYINECDTIIRHTSYPVDLALNYVVSFVPIPFTSPMGKVKSGIMSLSRYIPENSIRYAYPGTFGWPNRLFNLRRCMLVNRYPTENSKELVLINTHMSAFDDGSLKKQEMQFLKDFVIAEFSKGNYVVVAGDWNQSPPGLSLTRFGENYQSESFLLNNIDPDYIPESWQWVYDPTMPTNRYLNEAFEPGHTFTCIIDLFLISPNVEVIQNNTINLNFRNSDHNPISMNFRLLKDYIQ